MTRSGVPSKVMPSQSAMGVSADQFSVASPANVSRAASSASQSETRPGLLAASGTAVPVSQSLSQNGKLSWSKSFRGTSRSPAGTHPVNWLPEMCRRSRLDKLPSCEGIWPVNWLSLR